MKKLFLLLSFLFVFVSLFCQTAIDSTTAVNLSGITGLSTSLILTILGGILSIVGHFFVNGKWYSISLWAEKLSYGLYQFLHWLNEKTNKGQVEKSVTK